MKISKICDIWTSVRPWEVNTVHSSILSALKERVGKVNMGIS